MSVTTQWKNLQMDYLRAFEERKDAIVAAYVAVDFLELRLRKSIPEAIKQSQDREISPWFSFLDLSEKGLETLSRAQLIKPSSPEDFLPLSFWRHLLSNRHYASLWLPHLHRAFPKLNSPKKHSTFLEIDKAMDSALRVRNNIAHYNLEKLNNLNYSMSKINWLSSVMGG